MLKLYENTKQLGHKFLFIVSVFFITSCSPITKYYAWNFDKNCENTKVENRKINPGIIDSVQFYTENAPDMFRVPMERLTETCDETCVSLLYKTKLPILVNYKRASLELRFAGRKIPSYFRNITADGLYEFHLKTDAKCQKIGLRTYMMDMSGINTFDLDDCISVLPSNKYKNTLKFTIDARRLYKNESKIANYQAFYRIFSNRVRIYKQEQYIGTYRNIVMSIPPGDLKSCVYEANYDAGLVSIVDRGVRISAGS